MLYQMIRREGWRVRHKRVERLYREEGLSLRRRRRRKRLSHLRVIRPRPAAANQAWALDLVHDSLMSGRRFRALTVIDEWSRENLAIEVDVSLTGERIARVLNRLAIGRGVPAVLQSYNGPEFTGRVLDQWAYDNQVRLQFIEPGKPIQNAFIESFNSRLREECLNEHGVVSLDDARNKIERRRIEYNRQRPHSSLGCLTPEEFTAQNQGNSAIAEKPILQLEGSADMPAVEASEFEKWEEELQLKHLGKLESEAASLRYQNAKLFEENRRLKVTRVAGEAIRRDLERDRAQLLARKNTVQIR